MDPNSKLFGLLVTWFTIPLVFATNVGLLVEERYSHLLPLPVNGTMNASLPEVLVIGRCRVYMELLKSNNQQEISHKVSVLKDLNATLVVTYTTCETQQFLRLFLKLMKLSHICLPNLFCETSFVRTHVSPFRLQSHNSQLVDAVIDVITTLKWLKVFVFLDGFLDSEAEHLLLSGLTNRRIKFLCHRVSYGDPTAYNRSMQSFRDRVGELQFLLFMDTGTVYGVLQAALQMGILRKNTRWILGNLNIKTNHIEELNIQPEDINIVTFKSSRTSLVIPGCTKPQLPTRQVMFPKSPILEDAIRQILSCKSLSERVEWYLAGNTPPPPGNQLLPEISYFVAAVQYNETKKFYFLEIGEWKPSQTFTFRSRTPFPNFQPGFGNITLNIAYNLLRPFIVSVTDNNETRLEGFCMELIKQISRNLNFQFKMLKNPDKTFGSLNTSTHRWSGLIGMAARKEADLAIGPISITYARYSVVDFTQPYMPDGISILIQRENPNGSNYMQSFKVFSWQTWCCLIGAFILTVTTLTIVNRIYFSHITAEHSLHTIQSQSYWQNLWSVLGNAIKEGNPMVPINISGRVIIGCWWFFIILMSTTYTAHLVSYLAIPKKQHEIESLEELAQQSDLKPIALFASDKYDYFQETTNKYYKMLGNVMANGPHVTDEKSILDMVDNDNYAFISDDSVNYYIAGEFCGKYYVVQGETPQRGLAFVTPKHSLYLSDISNALLRIQQSGLIEKFKTKWWSSKDSCLTSSQSTDLVAKTIGMNNMAGIFMVYSGLALFAMICVAIEILVLRSSNKKKEENKKNENENESSKNESSKNESSKNESSKNESSKNELSKNESSKNESSKNESSKNESSKNESSKNESSKNELSKTVFSLWWRKQVVDLRKKFHINPPSHQQALDMAYKSN